MIKKYPALVTVLVLCAGCGATIGGAVLVDQSRQAGALLATHPDPAVAVPAQDIVLNSETLLKTDYENKLPANAPVYTPEVSAEARKAAEASHEAETGLWGLAKTALGFIPGWEWVATGLTALVALRERFRASGAIKQVAKAKDLVTSTFEGIQNFRKSAPDVWEALKGKLVDSHDEYGVRVAAKELAEKVEGRSNQP